jgi:ribosome-associated protein
MQPASGLRITARLTIPWDEIELRASRSSGPGGQHANVTSSRVEAVFDVASSRSLSDAQRARILERVGPRVTAVAQDARSQLRNRELALERLRAKIEAALRVRTPRRATAPTAASRRRRLDTKRANAERKRGRHPPALED